LSEIEKKVLCKVAVAKLQALNLGVHIRPPSGEYSELKIVRLKLFQSAAISARGRDTPDVSSFILRSLLVGDTELSIASIAPGVALSFANRKGNPAHVSVATWSFRSGDEEGTSPKKKILGVSKHPHVLI